MTRLTAGEVDANLAQLPGWARDGDFITKSFRFNKFMEGIEFVDRVARIAELLDHHPDIEVVWTTVTLRIQTHDEDGLTPFDFELAAKIEKDLDHRNLRSKKK